MFGPAVGHLEILCDRFKPVFGETIPNSTLLVRHDVRHMPAASAVRPPASTEESHAFDPAAPPATILNDVSALRAGRAFLNVHRLIAIDANQEIYQGAFIVVQMNGI